MTAPLWTRDEALQALGEKARAQGGDWQAGGVAIDSRAVKPGIQPAFVRLIILLYF